MREQRRNYDDEDDDDDERNESVVVRDDNIERWRQAIEVEDGSPTRLMCRRGGEREKISNASVD